MILVDPRYTSRTCSRCGHVVQSLPLSQRTFSCETCGNVMDRDWNAAINILNRGLGVEAVRKENGRRGRQHGCWPGVSPIRHTPWSNITLDNNA